MTTVDEEVELPEEILLKAGPADYDQAIVFVCRKMCKKNTTVS